MRNALTAPQYVYRILFSNSRTAISPSCGSRTGSRVSHIARAKSGSSSANSATCFWRSSRRRDGRSTKPEGSRVVTYDMGIYRQLSAFCSPE
jgi:hypothetical protein